MKTNIYLCKRLLTDEEFDRLIELEDPKKQKKFLEKLKEELFYEGNIEGRIQE